jgi:hypothetical protein
MILLTAKERDFLEQGGVLWCIRPIEGDRWEIYKKTWEKEDIFSVRPNAEEEAIRWIFVLVDLSHPDERIAIHHAIPRSHGNTEPRLLPLL